MVGTDVLAVGDRETGGVGLLLSTTDGIGTVSETYVSSPFASSPTWDEEFSGRSTTVVVVVTSTDTGSSDTFGIARGAVFEYVGLPVTVAGSGSDTGTESSPEMTSPEMAAPVGMSTSVLTSDALERPRDRDSAACVGVSDRIPRIEFPCDVRSVVFDDSEDRVSVSRLSSAKATPVPVLSAAPIPTAITPTPSQGWYADLWPDFCRFLEVWGISSVPVGYAGHALGTPSHANASKECMKYTFGMILIVSAPRFQHVVPGDGRRRRDSGTAGEFCPVPDM